MILKGKISRSVGDTSEDSLYQFIVVPVTCLKYVCSTCTFKTDLIFVTYIHCIVYIIMDAV